MSCLVKLQTNRVHKSKDHRMFHFYQKFSCDMLIGFGENLKMSKVRDVYLAG